MTVAVVIFLFALYPAQDSFSSQHLLFHNPSTGKVVYWSIDTTGQLKNRSRNDGWGPVGTWDMTPSWRMLAVQRNVGAQNLSHLIWQNTENGKLLYWSLDSTGVQSGMGWVATNSLPTSWQFGGIQYNADKQGNPHLVFHHTDNGKAAYWKLDSTGARKNASKGDGWDFINDDWTLLSPWSLIAVQPNADHAGNDHIIWRNSRSGATIYWKLDSTGVLKNRTQGDGWEYVSFSVELVADPDWRVVALQQNADKLGNDHLLFHNTRNGRVAYWQLDSTGVLKNREKGDGWDFVADSLLPSPWSFAALQSNANGQNTDHIIWHNTESGKLAYWKLNSIGQLKNRSRSDGWGWISDDWQPAPSWRVIGIDSAPY